mmetsp:Transcript_23220/g.54923  ORF Transcript_23220/g.54923 Transcript_23220/m.54923 type:complete len:214 (+) Transcript_23220:324-965(+)
MATVPLSSSSGTREADEKISGDLAVLREKMNLLESMLHPTDAAAPKLSVRTDEAVRAVIGYLDACAPRMIELVTACTARMGTLSERVFGDVLDSNDRLQKLLADVDTCLMTETTASTTVAAAAVVATGAAEAGPPDLANQFGDLLLGAEEDLFAEAPGSASAPTTTGAKTTGEDFFGEVTAAPPAAAPPAAPPTSANDSFDDFFAERAESNFK